MVRLYPGPAPGLEKGLQPFMAERLDHDTKCIASRITVQVGRCISESNLAHPETENPATAGLCGVLRDVVKRPEKRL